MNIKQDQGQLGHLDMEEMGGVEEGPCGTSWLIIGALLDLFSLLPPPTPPCPLTCPDEGPFPHPSLSDTLVPLMSTSIAAKLSTSVTNTFWKGQQMINRYIE